MFILKTVYTNVNQVDIWENADRQSDVKDDITKYAELKNTTNTLKEAFRNRPPVAEYIKEITRANKENIKKRQQRELDKLMNAAVYDDEDEAQQIYQEILQVVGANSPTSLPISRGSMAGYGTEIEHGDKQRIKDLTKPNQISGQIQNKSR